MEVMSRPLREHERPFTTRIDSELTGFEMKPRPRGKPCTVRFRCCSVNLVREHHLIGGEKTSKVVHKDELEGPELEVHGGSAVFRSQSACRGAILRMLMGVLHALIQDCDLDRTKEFVPAGLVEKIVAGAAAGGESESYACDVWMHVVVTRVYSQAEELLLLCEDAGAGPSGSAPGAGEACLICMEELADGVTGLPDCAHAFHRECILEWFGQAPTCPCCRLDMIQCIKLRQRAYLTAVLSLAVAAISSDGAATIAPEFAAAARANSSVPAAISVAMAAMSAAEGAAPSPEIAAAVRANLSALATAGPIRRHRQRRAAPYSAQHVARSDGEVPLQGARESR